jgi:hypothetical protein
MLIKLVQRGHIYCFLQFEYAGLLQDNIAAAEVLYLFEELTLYSLNWFRFLLLFP